MKKKYFIFLIMFSFFLYPKDIFAQDTYSIEPTHFYYFDSSGTGTQGVITQYRSDDIRWFGGYHNVDGFYRGFEYLFSPHNLVINKHYKVQFRFFSYPMYSNFSNPYIFSVDNWNDTFSSSCHADTSFDDSHRVLLHNGQYGGQTGWSSVTCDDFYLNNPSTISIKINGVFISDSLQRYNWGISSVTFTEIADYEMTNSIKGQTEEIKKQTEATKEQTETIKDSNTDEASNSANSFFDGFESDDYGLSDIVTMPLSFIKGLSSSTCNNLEFPVPFVEQNVELPCMSSIYKKHFNSFLQLYQIITTGIIAYWCCVNMFRLVQGFKDPDNDEIEVLDL